MSELNRVLATLVLLVSIGGIGGSLGGMLATSQITGCATSVAACQ